MTTLTVKPWPPRAGEKSRSTRTTTLPKALAVLVAVLGVVCLAPSAALAVFSRPYLTQLTGAPTGPLGEQVPFKSVEGLAVAPSSGGLFSDDVFVGTEGLVDVFSAANVFAPPQITGLQTNSLAYDEKSETLEGAKEKEYVAVDNSVGPAEGDVYRAAPTKQGAQSGAVYRTNGSGEPVPFTCAASHSGEYVKGNELTGRPGENGKPGEAWEDTVEPVNGVAVDSGSGPSAGDIYVIYNRGPYGNPLEANQIDEFTSQGCFVRAITGANVPEADVFHGQLNGVAVDPVHGDVLVEAQDSAGDQAIDEFTDSGGYLGKITGISQTDQFSFSGDVAGRGFISSRDGLAVGSNGDLYVGVREYTEAEEKEFDKLKEEGNQDPERLVPGKDAVDELGEGAYYPDAVTGGVSDARSGAVTLNGVVGGVEDTVAKEDLQLSGCRFEYVSDAAFKLEGFASANTKECAPALKGQRLKEEDYSVHAELENLEAGTVYRYRLVAETNPAERGISRAGAAESFAAPTEPVVEDVSVGDVSSSWADFHALIDPVGEDTTYHFEYLSMAAFAADGDSFAGPDSAMSVPMPAADVGSGDVGVSVNVQAAGLSPGTTYDYRAVASNGVGVSDGVNGTFSTSPAVVPGLPDGRSFEMLTPPNKEDAEDMFVGLEGFEGQRRAKEGLGGAENFDTGYSSEDGDHFLLANTASAFGSFPASFGDSYVFSRGADGWSFQPGASPSLGVQSGRAVVYDPFDFSAIGFHDFLGSSADEKHVPIVNLVGPAGGPYATIESGVSKEVGEVAPTEATMVGGSANLSVVILESEDRELGVAKEDSKQDEQSHALYEWTAAGGLRVVNFNSEGKLSKCGAVLGQSGGSTAVAARGSTHGAVSADGARVFFTAPDPEAPSTEPGCWNGAKANPPELYVREGGETTVEVSAPERGVALGGANPAEPAIFVGASKDGSKVFFMTRTELTEEAVKLGLHDLELYEYDFEGPEGEWLTRVSRGQSEAATPATDAGAVEDVPAVSGDGSAVYFNAGAELVRHAGGGGGLYRYDTVTQQTVYVAPNPGYPAPEFDGGGISSSTWYAQVLNPALQGGGSEEHYAGLDVTANYYTTGDGGYLVFPSRLDIAGYDSGGQQELYRYDAGSGSHPPRLVCVSCNPDGSVPNYGATFARSSVENGNPAGTAPRPISEDGSYVFFDTLESLTPADTNDKVDVYEWHEDPETHEAAVSSISTGQSTTDDFFLDSSPDGKNVFFGTHSALVPADKDNQGDLYDARVEGGFPAPLPPGICEGDTCGHPPAAPIDATPGSLTLSGPGDVVTEIPPPSTPTKTVTKKIVKCKREYFRKKVKKKEVCVKQKPQKKTRAEKAGDNGRAKS